MAHRIAADAAIRHAAGVQRALSRLAAGMLMACSAQPEQAAAPPAPVPVAAPAAASDGPPPTLSAAEQARQDSAQLLTAVVQARFPQLQVIDFKVGDLNADGRRDAIVVAGPPCGSRQPSPQMVLLLLNAGAGRLRIAAVNHHGLLMPAAREKYWPNYFRFVGRQFEFGFFEGSCQRTYYHAVFRYEPARRDWFLHRRQRIDRDCSNGDVEELMETPRNFGRVRFVDYSGGEF